MKKSFSKLPIFVLVLSMATILLALRQNVLARKKFAQRILLAAILPLSSKPRASRMFAKGIMCCALIVVCMSCKSLDPATLHHATQHYTTQHNVTHDTIYLHDSVYVSERQRGDTVYLTRVEWRDRWRTRVERDTVVDVRVEKEVVELPPKRYVPKFYKWTAAIFWTGIALLILYLILKSYLHF